MAPSLLNSVHDQVAASTLEPDQGLGGKPIAQQNGSLSDPLVKDLIPKLSISSDYQVTEAPVGTISPVRIICVGAGASGVNLAYQVQKNMKRTELVIYEKNPSVGGTWYENRYPGCKCDIREYFTTHVMLDC